MTIHVGDCREVLKTLPDQSVQCCVTSPPYFGLRDYGIAEQIGLESSVDAYVDALVDVFREVRRVLADDGTVWLNLGDSYAGGGGGGRGDSGRQFHANGDGGPASQKHDGVRIKRANNISNCTYTKPKDLIGVPWRVAFALQADGWWLRNDIIWAKPNPMPESVRDRCTRSHEYVFHLAKSARYFHDADAIREDFADERKGASGAKSLPYSIGSGRNDTLSDGTKPGLGVTPQSSGRNKRTVWTITPKPFPGSHFAVMPVDLVEPCIKAGSRDGDAVLDPFAGAGTVGLVAARLGRSFVGIELNPEYAAIARDRIASDAPLLSMVAD